MPEKPDQNFQMSFNSWLSLGFLSILWGSSFALNEKLLEQLPPITIVWCRQLCASILFLIVALPHFKNTQFSVNVLWRLSVVGLVAIAIPFCMFSIGQQYITSVLAGIGNGSVPFFTMIWATILLADERIKPLAFFGIIFGFFGLVLLFWPLLSAGEFDSAGGLLVVTLASVLYGFANVFVRSIPPIPLLIQGFIINFSALIALTPAMFWENPDWGMYSWEGVGYTILHGGLGSFGAYIVYLKLINKIGSVNTSQVAYLIPFASLFLGVIWLGEEITLWAMGGFLMVFIGLWIKDKSQKQSLPT